MVVLHVTVRDPVESCTSTSLYTWPAAPLENVIAGFPVIVTSCVVAVAQFTVNEEAYVIVFSPDPAQALKLLVVIFS
jgi:hypothetical protein